MSEKITGACLCGRVSYSLSKPPKFSGNCHCRACQKATGTAFASEMFFEQVAVEMSGELKVFERKADSGKLVWQHFCPNCGTWLFTKAEVIPGMLGVAAGTLDDTSNYKPQYDAYQDSATHWCLMQPHLPKFSKMPA